MKVLVVDDEEAIKSLFQQWYYHEIEEGLFDFSFALSSEEALNYLEKSDFHVILILSDIAMPGINGLELLKVIKSRKADIPVIIITAYGDEINYKTAINYGVDDFIRKPLDMSMLKQKLIAYLNKQKK